MEISVLASGSSGNCTFLESKYTSILIDAGISSRSIAKKLSDIGKDISNISAIFVTHEHNDHVKGLERLSRNFDIPVYMNKETYGSLGVDMQTAAFFSEKAVKIQDLTINPVPISHDAANPCGFFINGDKKNVGIFTDFGKPNRAIENCISKSDCLVLETNHDIDMLINGPYPYPLKQRILGDKGHLSNIDAGMLVKNCSSESLKNVFLAHLSRHNNTGDLAMETFSAIAGQNKMLNLRRILTDQETPTEIIKI